jgi:hypothetical protein
MKELLCKRNKRATFFVASYSKKIVICFFRVGEIFIFFEKLVNIFIAGKQLLVRQEMTKRQKGLIYNDVEF